MIVKNEEHCIQRCLKSVRKVISNYVIIDTGSTDRTKKKIRRQLSGVPGKILDRPWVNFGHNRSEALEEARKMPDSDYILMIDADDALQVGKQFYIPPEPCDGFMIPVVYGEIRYERVQLFSKEFPWRFEGALHEFPSPMDGKHLPYIRNLTSACMSIKVYKEGARSKDPDLYRKDAEILLKEVTEHPHYANNPRSTFYLAQSYRDCGEDEKALEWYTKRYEMKDGWQQEAYIARLEAAKCKERLGHDPMSVVAAYTSAHNHTPTRAEAMYNLARVFRCNGGHEGAYEAAKAAVEIARPLEKSLFLHEAVYTWRAVDEYAVACYNVGKYAECLEACVHLLYQDFLPQEEAERVRANWQFAREKLP